MSNTDQSVLFLFCFHFGFGFGRGKIVEGFTWQKFHQLQKGGRHYTIHKVSLSCPPPDEGVSLAPHLTASLSPSLSLGPFFLSTIFSSCN